MHFQFLKTLQICSIIWIFKQVPWTGYIDENSIDTCFIQLNIYWTLNQNLQALSSLLNVAPVAAFHSM